MFLRGFTEAIGVAVALVAVYLALNVVVIGVACGTSPPTRSLVPDWTHALIAQHGNPLAMVGVALLVFPKLALGMSGFETGVAVMPHVRGDAGRHRGAPDRPDPGHQAAPHHGGGDDERLPGHQLASSPPC